MLRGLNSSSPRRGEQGTQVPALHKDQIVPRYCWPPGRQRRRKHACPRRRGKCSRGGLTRSVERDMSGGERTGGSPAETGAPSGAAGATSTAFPTNSHYSAKRCWISLAFCALRGVFSFSSPLCHPPPPIAAPGGAVSEYTLSRGRVCWESLLAALFQRIKP